MCEIEGCNKPARSKGLCAAHYQQHRRRERDPETGTRKPGPRPDPTAERSRYNAENPTRKRLGKAPRKTATATHCANGHEFTEGSTYLDPSGRAVCKQCRRDSQRRYKGRGPVEGPVGPHNRDKTHCKKGHPYDKVGFVNSDGFRWCRVCRRASWVERIYGVTPEHWDRLVLEQEGRCAGCLKDVEGELHVDHDHTTEAPRGLLCKHCNYLLGHAFDSPDTLRRLAVYLENLRAQADRA